MHAMYPCVFHMQTHGSTAREPYVRKYIQECMYTRMHGTQCMYVFLCSYISPLLNILPKTTHVVIQVICSETSWGRGIRFECKNQQRSWYYVIEIGHSRVHTDGLMLTSIVRNTDILLPLYLKPVDTVLVCSDLCTKLWKRHLEHFSSR
jgi:hypothetical protein